MPTRKQRRRELKSKRHQYEFVYLDAEGNELDEAPPELLEQEEQRTQARTNGGKPAAASDRNDKKKGQPQRRGVREPHPPSWNRALKRGGLLGLVVFAMFGLTSKGHYVQVLPLALLYTALFVPFTFFVDRFAYRRFQARQASGGGGSTPRPAKKR
jgi:hypothetical protein